MSEFGFGVLGYCIYEHVFYYEIGEKGLVTQNCATLLNCLAISINGLVRSTLPTALWLGSVRSEETERCN